MKTIRLSPDTLETLAGADDDDPIVWQCYGAFPNGDGTSRFRYVTMTQSTRERLLAAFGAEWLEQHLAKVERDIAAFEATGTYGVQ